MPLVSVQWDEVSFAAHVLTTTGGTITRILIVSHVEKKGERLLQHERVFTEIRNGIQLL